MIHMQSIRTLAISFIVVTFLQNLLHSRGLFVGTFAGVDNLDEVILLQELDYLLVRTPIVFR